TPGDARSLDLLDALLDKQPYRLSFWRVAADEINYRRFFDINDLAALSMERPEVFCDTHRLVLRLPAEGALDGPRSDHPAGLNDLFVDPEAAKPLTRFYHEFSGLDDPFPDVVYRNKLLTLRVALSSELQMLAFQLDRLAQKNRYSRDFTLNSLRDALRQVIACFPVYRSYISDEGVHE